MGVHGHVIVLSPPHRKEEVVFKRGPFVGRTSMEMWFMLQKMAHTHTQGEGEWRTNGSDIVFNVKTHTHSFFDKNGQICIHRPESPRLRQVKPKTLTFCIPKQELALKRKSPGPFSPDHLAAQIRSPILQTFLRSFVFLGKRFELFSIVFKCYTSTK